MPGQMLAEIGASDLILLAAFIPNNDNLDALRLFQQRPRIADGACGGAAAIPAHHDLIELERVFLDVRDDNDRASGFEQGGLGNNFFDSAFLRLGLSDDREIEAARNAAEHLADAGEACAYGQ